MIMYGKQVWNHHQNHGEQSYLLAKSMICCQKHLILPTNITRKLQSTRPMKF